MAERYDAYADLGGHATALNEGQEQAMYNMGLASKEIRARVEARNTAKENAAQNVINKAGAAAYRSAGVENDKARGVDVTSTEYLLEQKIAERNRTRRV